MEAGAPCSGWREQTMLGTEMGSAGSDAGLSRPSAPAPRFSAAPVLGSSSQEDKSRDVTFGPCPRSPGVYYLFFQRGLASVLRKCV